MSNVCDACGWAAAFGGMLAFGSFGVPIKSKVAQSLDIDPLVFQTYKTTMCFLTSWFVLLYGEELTFTPWGIVSGLFWVPGGIGTIYAVQNAGLAIGIGVSSSFIVLVSFTWGIFVFDEHVHNRLGACSAVGCMMLGLLGMAYYSAPTQSTVDESSEEGGELGDNSLLPSNENGSDAETPAGNTSSDLEGGCDYVPLANSEEEIGDAPILLDDDSPESSPCLQSPEEYVLVCGMKWQRRTMGILVAIFTNIFGGSIMVPMKWAPDDAKGLAYLISFSIGASLVTLTLWVIRYLYLCRQHGSVSEAYNALPSFHFQKMWPYGCTCGLLWSIGNFFSILSVEYLGEGVGYSAVQTSILVSGLWGIFYFREIKGAETMAKWLISASVTLCGILLLSYEHHEK